MGLDVYVGPLSRYYTGQWETVVQQWGRQIGPNPGPAQSFRTLRRQMSANRSGRCTTAARPWCHGRRACSPK